MLLGLIVVFVGVSRYFYTERTRDRRLWHRRYFDVEKEPTTQTDKCASAPSPALDFSSVIDSRPVQCIKETGGMYKSWLDTTAAEIENNIATTSLFPKATVADSCKA